MSVWHPGSKTRPAWAVLLDGLGVPAGVATGAAVTLRPDGLSPVEGVADYVSPRYLGVRTADALYRFHERSVLGLPPAVGHHLYGPTDGGPAPDQC